MQPLLHPQTRTQLDALQPGNARSYIFHGAQGAGKATTARELARRFNCLGDDPALCANCRRLQAGSFPDLIMLAPEDKPSITIEQVRGVIHTLSLSTYDSSGTRVVVVDQASALTIEAQNALLKLIEEPPAQTQFVLITEQPESLLPTIRSRCAAIYFAPVPEADIAALLSQHHGVPGSQAADFASTAAGAPGTAINLSAQPELAAARLQITRQAELAPELPLFKRLLLAKRLVEDKADLALFSRLLQAALTDRLTGGQVRVPIVAAQLDALERFRLQLQAKVAPRVALESLMLEL